MSPNRLSCNHYVCKEGIHILGCAPNVCGASICTLWFAAAIYSDWDKLINAEFCKEVFKLTGIDEYKSPVYWPKCNGRAENAVQLVVNSLRKLLNQKHSWDWVQLLPWRYGA